MKPVKISLLEYDATLNGLRASIFSVLVVQTLIMKADASLRGVNIPTVLNQHCCENLYSLALGYLTKQSLRQFISLASANKHSNTPSIHKFILALVL
jgi:hypothetical protein